MPRKPRSEPFFVGTKPEGRIEVQDDHAWPMRSRPFFSRDVPEGWIEVVHPDPMLDTMITFKQNGDTVRYEVLDGRTRVAPEHVAIMAIEGFKPVAGP